MNSYKRNIPKKILIIRRDNIGDLLCVTPSIRALKSTCQNCNVTLLVNSYNRDVIANNPDIDKIEVYTKAKHNERNKSLLLVFFEKFKMILRLRKSKFDYVIIASSGERIRDWSLAKLFKPNSIVGYLSDKKIARKKDISLDIKIKNFHEVEYVFNLFRQIGVRGVIPPMQLYSSDCVDTQGMDHSKTAIGINISTRKDSQRWPIESFYRLIKELNKDKELIFLIFWSPGSRSNPKHPGDDENATELIKLCNKLPVVLYPDRWKESNTLQDLIDGLSLCDYVITSDGGAMHIAAALKKSIICLFGGTSATHWHPWSVDYNLLQAHSNDVKDISVNDVKKAFSQIQSNFLVKS
jgi:ADP-heptose:LPS heptosyltransferase